MTRDCDDYESFLFRAKMMSFAEYPNLKECLKAIISNQNTEEVYKNYARIALEKMN